MDFIYEDVKCPHCNKMNRVRFKIDMYFNSFKITSKIEICVECKEEFKPTVEILYGARKTI